MKKLLKSSLKKCPLIAILRGIRPEQCIEVTETLIATGFTIIEVPLMSDEALESIARMSEAFGSQVIIGAGTVLTVEQVDAVKRAGGQLIFSPNFDQDVVKQTVKQSMISVPGCATPTEAFSALKAGADMLKFFPAENIPPAAIKAMKVVLPRDTLCVAVGGITKDNMPQYIQAGVSGFGIGSSLFTPDKSIEQVRSSALEIVEVVKLAR